MVRVSVRPSSAVCVLQGCAVTMPVSGCSLVCKPLTALCLVPRVSIFVSLAGRSCPAYEVYSLLALKCICIEGYKRHASSGQCRLCPIGTYKHEAGDQACSACPAGTYGLRARTATDVTGLQTGSNNCTSCPAHSNSVNGSTVTGCKCNIGYTGPDGGTCVACMAGTFKTSNGTEECTQCSAGKYSTETGEISAATCTDCPSNTYSPSGGRLLTNCTCNKGYTGPDGAACAACTAGTYKDVNGSAPCSLCAQGKYSTAVAAINEATCSKCPTHTYSHGGSSMLTNCTCNKGYTGPDGAACAACIVGTYKDLNGSGPCSLCTEGKYSAQTGEIF